MKISQTLRRRAEPGSDGEDSASFFGVSDHKMKSGLNHEKSNHFICMRDCRADGIRTLKNTKSVRSPMRRMM